MINRKKTPEQLEAQCLRIMDKASARAEVLVAEFGTNLESMGSAVSYMTERERSRLHFARTELMKLTQPLAELARARIISRRGLNER